MRGAVTDQIRAVARERLGLGDITTTELRLLPYIQYTMMNNQRIEPEKINDKERSILSDWRARGWIGGGAAGLTVTKEFWDAMNEILWLAYVAHAEN